MTLQRLEQYRVARRELDTLKRRLASIKARAVERVFDTVQASDPEFPYTPRAVHISGCSIKLAARYKGVAASYTSKQAWFSRETSAIKSWIATIQESRVRRIMELRFIAGLSWEAVALRVYGRACGDAARKRAVRFFEEKT